MNDELWQNFLNTGSVSDYLKYKQYSQIKGMENKNADENQGTDYKGTEYR